MIIFCKYRHGLIKWWVGTDAFTLTTYPPGDRTWMVRIFFRRIIWRILWPFFEHWAVNSGLADILIDFGIPRSKIKTISYPCNYPKIFDKKRHNVYTVLFYLPKHEKNKKYKLWVYGYDILKQIEQAVDNVNFIWLDGKTYDMSQVFPVADAYLKIVRQPGQEENLLGKECKMNGIEVIELDYNLDDKKNTDKLIGYIMYSRDKWIERNKYLGWND